MRTTIIKMQVDVTSRHQAVEQLLCWAREGKGRYVCVSNVHMCMETFDDPSFRKIVNGADLIVPDGKPIHWAQKVMGFPEAEQLRGEDLTLALCKAAEKEGITVGFYGSTNPVLIRLLQFLKRRYPRLQVDYSHTPPFRSSTPEEDAKDIENINKSGIGILFVGLGCPKQETWMAAHRDHLGCVMVGIGAAFDFIAGNKRNAPRWIQNIGMEWLYRLLSEPRRLWKRYLTHNPRFLWYFGQQMLLGRKF